MTTPYDSGLQPGPATHLPLTPLGFLSRAATVFPGKTAVIDGERPFTYAEFDARCRCVTAELDVLHRNRALFHPAPVKIAHDGRVSGILRGLEKDGHFPAALIGHQF